MTTEKETPSLPDRPGAPTHSRDNANCTAQFGELLDALGYTDGERLGISWDPVGGEFTSAVIDLVIAEAFTDRLPEGDVWFGVNPTSAPHGVGVRRGTANQVTRLAALFADLDVKPGGCDTLEQAHAIVAALSDLLGEHPAAIVNSGGGLHPYWPIEPEDGGPLNTDERRAKAAALLRRWGRLVKLVAHNHGADVDPVFDLARVLRVPGTHNHKSEPVPVTMAVGAGGPVTVASLGELLDDQDIEQLPTDTEIVSVTAPPVSDPQRWGYAEHACGEYTASMIKGWATDNANEPRHPWLLAQAVRIASAHRNGCLTADMHKQAIGTLSKRFTELCARPGDTRPVKRFEVAEAIDYGIRLAARKTDAEVINELGGIKHFHNYPKAPEILVTQLNTTPSGAPATPPPVSPGGAKQPGKLCARWADTVEDTVPDWAWEYDGKGRILRGAVTLFGGRPGAGKSTTGRWFAAGWTNGTLPGCWEGQPINVAYIATEEAWHHTVRPSLRAVDANMKRVMFIERDGEPARIRSTTDEAELTQLFLDNDIRAVFLDPLMSTIGGAADIHRNNEVRDYLDPWVRISEKIDGPVIGICHMTKAPTGDVVASITGSSAFGELARCVFGFAVDREADDGTRVMSQAKNSAGHEDLSIAYRLGSRQVTTSDRKTADVARFELIGNSEKNVRDLLIAERSAGTKSGTGDCTRWLKGYLTVKGRTLREDVAVDATEVGFSPKMLRTAAGRVGVIFERTREIPPRTYWSLPGAGQ